MFAFSVGEYAIFLYSLFSSDREKEKSETKDRKVLEIIQVKDDRIEELQNIVAKQSEEISDILSK